MLRWASECPAMVTIDGWGSYLNSMPAEAQLPSGVLLVKDPARITACRLTDGSAAGEIIVTDLTPTQLGQLHASIHGLGDRRSGAPRAYAGKLQPHSSNWGAHATAGPHSMDLRPVLKLQTSWGKQFEPGCAPSHPRGHDGRAEALCSI